MKKMLRKKCPVCLEKSWIRSAQKNYKFQNNFVADIYDCTNCKARFILPYKAGNIHEVLHRNAQIDTASNRTYQILLRLGKQCAECYHSQNIKEYRKLLNEEKYRFIIDYVLKNYPKGSQILEVGCAEGYLTGYFLLEQYNVTGTDISETAIDFCKKNYGDFFFAGDIRNLKGKKYDVICHTGLIGVIDFPKQFLNTCIDLLNEDGSIIFNVPNRFRLDGQWTETMPPDLRTLFTAGTFRKLIKRKDVTIEFQYSEKGKRYNISEKFFRIKSAVSDLVDYKCFTDRNPYNLYIIIKKRGK